MPQLFRTGPYLIYFWSEASSAYIIEKWIEHFGQIRYYC